MKNSQPSSVYITQKLVNMKDKSSFCISKLSEKNLQNFSNMF
jgi:hypothetical protein